MLACQLFAGVALAQPADPRGDRASARELVELKGGAAMFDPVIVSIVEQTKGALLQTNPQLAKDLNDVGDQLRNEFAPRRNELMTEAAKLYANRFTEQELKDMADVLQVGARQEDDRQEPLVLDETFNFVQQWAPRVGEEVMNRFRAEMKKKGHNL